MLNKHRCLAEQHRCFNIVDVLVSMTSTHRLYENKISNDRNVHISPKYNYFKLDDTDQRNRSKPYYINVKCNVGVKSNNETPVYNS